MPRARYLLSGKPWASGLSPRRLGKCPFKPEPEERSYNYNSPRQPRIIRCIF
ncbi:hypothetical protein M378DRAFT_162566 [Amanita muscaria Koide BX008]|uniref:Uncharacterized protein n=1 Tax=Amanita muscaria (strain Koide BX008) TaxID=946122 RepID=A0A0C2SP65_AMAMK|nr:hypothetical protein M378DRAFT_162566 [Amanita muscaria Koide BX008]